MTSTLIRGDDDGLAVRRFADPADAQAACAAREEEPAAYAYAPGAITCAIKTPPASVQRGGLTKSHKLAHELGISPSMVRKAIMKGELPAIPHGERSLMIPNRICRLVKTYGLRGVAGMVARGEL